MNKNKQAKKKEVMENKSYQPPGDKNLCHIQLHHNITKWICQEKN